jgi:hypothetical protein
VSLDTLRACGRSRTHSQLGRLLKEITATAGFDRQRLAEKIPAPL